MKVTEFIPCTLHQIHLGVEALAQCSFFFVHDLLTGLDVGLFRALFFHRLQFSFLILQLGLECLFAVLINGVALFEEICFKLCHVFVALVDIDSRNKPSSEVNNFFKLLCLQLFFWLKTTKKVRKP